MSRYASALGLFLLAASLAPASAEEDRLGVAGPIELSGTTYRLAFTSEPQPGYLKQEYLPRGQTLDEFEAMVLAEFLTDEMDTTSVARAQIQMLEERRAFDPLVNYDVFVADDDNGIILDFLLSGETDEGVSIAEWNAYRYVVGENASGDEGTWLLALSRRAYGNDITPFLERLGDKRSDDVAAVAAKPVPASPAR